MTLRHVILLLYFGLFTSIALAAHGETCKIILRRLGIIVVELLTRISACELMGCDHENEFVCFIRSCVCQNRL